MPASPLEINAVVLPLAAKMCIRDRPYSPELNLIEIRWHKIKYEWFPLRAYLSFDHLQSELQNILDQVGSKYKITFG